MIPEVSQIVRRTGIGRILAFRPFQHDNGFRLIGETIIGTGSDGLLQGFQGSSFFTPLPFKPGLVIQGHRINRFSALFGNPGPDQSGSLPVKPRLCIVQRKFNVRVNISTDEAFQRFLSGTPSGLRSGQQHLLVQNTEVKPVQGKRPLSQREGIVSVPHVAQDAHFQVTGFMMVSIPDQRAVDQVQGIIHILLFGSKLRKPEIAAVHPGRVPNGLVKNPVSLLITLLKTQSQSQVEIWPAIQGIGITPGQGGNGCPEIRFSLCKPASSQVPQPKRVGTAAVLRVAPEGFLVIRPGVIGGVPVLLQVKPRQKELFIARDLFGLPGRLCGFGNRLFPAGFRLPAYQESSI